MAFPLKNDPEKADQFFMGFLKSITENPETKDAWAGLKMLIGVEVTDLKLGYTIDSTQGEIKTASGFPENPDAGITFTSDVFHDLFLGNTNPVMALAMRKIKTTGPTQNVLHLANILPQNFNAYRNYLESQGYSV